MKQKRLEAICSYLNPADNPIDIGCDHGYVAIAASKKGCQQVLATDIHQNALAIAQRNIKKEHLEKRIKTLCTDGLENVDLKPYNTIIIAGMGSSTIKHILKKEKLENIEKIILQSNNDLKDLREYLLQIGYALEDETIVFEKKHYYVIMNYKKKVSSLKPEERYFGLYKVENRPYYQYLMDYYNKVLEKIPWYKWQEKKTLKKEIKLLKKYL